jgi:ABC-type uncharacterized transport system permease subunit
VGLREIGGWEVRGLGSSMGSGLWGGLSGELYVFELDARFAVLALEGCGFVAAEAVGFARLFGLLHYGGFKGVVGCAGHMLDGSFLIALKEF